MRACVLLILRRPPDIPSGFNAEVLAAGLNLSRSQLTDISDPPNAPTLGIVPLWPSVAGMTHKGIAQLGLRSRPAAGIVIKVQPRPRPLGTEKPPRLWGSLPRDRPH